MSHPSLWPHPSRMISVLVHIIMQLLFWRDALCQGDVRFPPKIAYPSHDEEIYYRDNDTAQISCSLVVNHYHTLYTWNKNGTLLLLTNDIDYDRNIGVLHILKFSRSLEGSYRCIATNIFLNSNLQQSQASSISPVITLKRFWLEQFSGSVYNAAPPMHFEYLSLPCGDHGTSTGPDLTYRWVYTNNFFSISRGRFFVNLKGHAGVMGNERADRLAGSASVGGVFMQPYIPQTQDHSGLHRKVQWAVDARWTLFINWLHANDRGLRIACTISTNLHGINYTEMGRPITIVFNLNSVGPTEAPPVMRYVSPTVNARLNSNAVLECMISFYDGASRQFETTKWNLASGKLIRQDAKYEFHSSGRRLTIRNVTFADEMYYTCWVSNHYDSESARVYLNVTSAPVFTHGPPPDKTVLQGEEASFNCEATSVTGENSTDKPIWYINAAKMGPINNHAKFYLNDNETILTVKNVQKMTDIMCVQCAVRNEIDTAFANACLNIFLPMVIVSSPPSVQNVKHGDKVNLTVVAIPDPPSELHYRWEFGNESFYMNSTNPYFVVNPATMEAYIDTSLIAADELEEMEGHYNIVVYHDFETRTMETDVIIIPQIMTTAADTGAATGSNVSSPQSTTTEVSALKPTDVMLPVVVGLILLIALIVFLIGLSQCARKRGTTNVRPREEEEGLGHL